MEYSTDGLSRRWQATRPENPSVAAGLEATPDGAPGALRCQNFSRDSSTPESEPCERRCEAVTR